MNERISPIRNSTEEKVEVAVCLWFAALVAGFVFASWHWPMVGDAAFMHYIIFLMHHGMAPYRDIADMNLPGSYLLEATSMEVFGPGSFGWRLYDFALLAIASVSLITILRPRGRLAGITASALFILIHGRDGVLMSGERDFAAAVFLLLAVALLFEGIRKRPSSALTYSLVGCSGIVSGLACCVKPTLLPMVVALFLWMSWCLHKRSVSITPFAIALIMGLIMPVIAMMDFLFRERVFHAFWGDLHGLIAYHAALDPVSLSYLVTQSISPLLGLFVLWIVAAFVLRKSQNDQERMALVLCAICGFLSYVLQRKGFWYQRYPFLAFLLPLFATDFARLIQSRSRWRLVGIAGVVAGVVLATQCLIRLDTFDHAEPARPLLADLETIDSPQRLSSHIQCMDTIGDCLDTLYAARIVQSTGFLYDCYLLDGNNPTVLALRRQFWYQLLLNPPKVIVVTDSVCYQPIRSFNKYGRWPEFQSYLAVNYTLARESGVQKLVRYWSRPLTPFAYRIYVRR